MSYVSFFAGLHSKSGLWIDVVRLSVRLSSIFWLTFAFMYWNLLCNPALPSLAVSCLLFHSLVSSCVIHVLHFVICIYIWVPYTCINVWIPCEHIIKAEFGCAVISFPFRAQVLTIALTSSGTVPRGKGVLFSERTILKGFHAGPLSVFEMSVTSSLCMLAHVTEIPST